MAPLEQHLSHHRHGADDCTPQPWFNPLRYSHELLPYIVREKGFSLSGIQPRMRLQSILGVRVGDV